MAVAVADRSIRLEGLQHSAQKPPAIKQEPAEGVGDPPLQPGSKRPQLFSQVVLWKRVLYDTLSSEEWGIPPELPPPWKLKSVVRYTNGRGPTSPGTPCGCRRKCEQHATPLLC
jgi:hypothetical protein